MTDTMTSQNIDLASWDTCITEWLLSECRSPPAKWNGVSKIKNGFWELNCELRMLLRVDW